MAHPQVTAPAGGLTAPGLDDVDVFTAWILTWQHWILPSVAILFVASLTVGR